MFQMTQYNKDHVPTWLARSLQSFVFWVAYKSLRNKKARIKEATLQEQLTSIMEQCSPDGHRAREELKYRNISPLEMASSDWEADIAVRRFSRHETKGRIKNTRFVFEIKIADATPPRIDHDLHKLATLSLAKQARKQDCRTFLLLLGRDERHTRFTEMRPATTTVSAKSPNLRFTYETHGIFTATAINQGDEAKYLYLVEVVALQST